MTTVQNPFVWYDLMTPDVEGAKKFYGAVVGWTFSPQPPAYTVLNVNNIGIGGIMETPENLKGMPPFWSGYIYVPDVGKACAEIKKLGGAVHREPWDIPGVIRMAVVSDPTGAVFNIMQPLTSDEMPRVKPGTQGTIGWHELHAGDLAKAWDFYAKMFGWTKGNVMNMGPPAGDYQLFQLGGKDIGGMMNKMPQMPRPVWAYYFNVDGIDAAASRISKAGGKITMGPHQVPGGQWIVMAQDPQGGFFSLVSNTK
jgi:uncharacterized protein